MVVILELTNDPQSRPPPSACVIAELSLSAPVTLEVNEVKLTSSTGSPKYPCECEPCSVRSDGEEEAVGSHEETDEVSDCKDQCPDGIE